VPGLRDADDVCFLMRRDLEQCGGTAWLSQLRRDFHIGQAFGDSGESAG